MKHNPLKNNEQHTLKVRFKYDLLGRETSTEVLFRLTVVNELAVVFPCDWIIEKFRSKNIPRYLNMNVDVVRGIIVFFNLPYHHMRHLFCIMGENQSPDMWGGKKLDKDSPPQDFAENIREYLKRKR